MKYLSPTPPPIFSNPYERRILKLEKHYSQALSKRRLVDELKQMRQEIKLLKAELSLVRGS